VQHGRYRRRPLAPILPDATESRSSTRVLIAMQIEPSQDNFTPGYAAGKPQLVWTTLVADLETPVSAYLKIARDRPLSFLLESVEGGATRGRYSIIGLEPDLIWRTHGKKAEINRRARADAESFTPCAEPPLTALRGLLAESRIEVPEGLPPMAAGVFGYLSYDMVRLMEELPSSLPDPIGIPDATLIRPTVVVVFDNVKDTLTVVTPVRPEAGVAASAAYNRAVDRLGEIVERLDSMLFKSADDHEGPIEVPTLSNTSADEYRAMVLRAKEYIAAGDIFQVVLAQRFETPFSLPPFALYRALRRVNPAPFLFYLDYGTFSVVGSSPEILVRARKDIVTIRPIAGTRPRGATLQEDKALEEELLGDPKERAEHLMLLDLGRNDVGRVAEIGSVKVTDQFFVERYSHVMHIVSNVEGKLDPKYDVIDALAGGFPAGTVSGAPKVRAMQIIDELEKEKRGLYAGCVGCFSADGEMDTCIVLRTALIKDGKMYVQAGAGIVADSNPTSEQAECVNKARGLFRAAEEAQRFASGVMRGQ
jgi:anthranilate synthase component 1